MDEEHAYRQALEVLNEHRTPRASRTKGGGRGPRAKTVAEEEPIPFSLDGCGRLVE